MDEIIFTMQPRISGFTDQLVEFKAFYKLGLSIGYKYYFQPFQSPRSANLDGQGQQMTFMDLNQPSPSFFKRAVRKIKRSVPLLNNVFGPPPAFDVFDFIGFNDYFSDKGQIADLKDWQPHTLHFGGTVAENVAYQSVDVLRQFISDEGQKIARGNRKCYLNLQVMDHNRIPYAEINSVLDQIIDFRSIYWDHRSKQPWPAIYPQGKIKTFIHVRQGDTALVETPWNSYITLWPERHPIEYGRRQDIPQKGAMIKIEDFYQFYKGFSGQFAAGQLAGLLFSDGFVRAERRLYNQRASLNLSDEKLHSLRAALQRYDVEKFEDFEMLPNFKTIIGEGPQKLCHFIHSFLTADLVIVGRHQNMVLKLLNLFCTAQNMPQLVFLTSSTEPSHLNKAMDRWLDKEMQENILLVDLQRPDFAAIADWVRERLPAEQAMETHDG